MKQFLFTLCLLFSLNSFSQEAASVVEHSVTIKGIDVERCMLRAEQEFEAARARTLSQVSVEHGEIIKRYRFVRLNGHAGRWADTDAVKFIIRLNTDMCELPKQEQDIIIAHEWGHAISFLHYPKLLEERRSNIQMHSEETYERIANVYAVTIYPNEKVDQALTFMETLCKQDRPYQCQRVAAWRQGIGRYN